MNAESLKALSDPDLSTYLWKRLRLETPIEPPLSGLYGEEPPEDFVLGVASEASEGPFHVSLTEAVGESLDRILEMYPQSVQLWGDRRTDEQLASLAFLAAALGDSVLTPHVHRMIIAWTTPMPSRITPSQCHLLRTLGSLQRGDSLRDLWVRLWNDGPREIRAEIIFGYARADAGAALAKLGELLDMGTEIDLPMALRGLIGSKGPGLDAVLQAARGLNFAQKKTLRDALVMADVEPEKLEMV